MIGELRVKRILGETYFEIRNSEQYIRDDVIRPQESISYTFDLEGFCPDAKHRLFFTGETQMFYLWKNEPDAKKMYYEIEDALDCKHAVRDRYCLNLSMKRAEDYVKRTVYETPWPPKLSYLPAYPESDVCQFGISVSADGLAVSDKIGGYIRFVLEVWEKRDGCDPKLTGRTADKRYEIEIPEGSYSMTEILQNVSIPVKTTARAVVTLEGYGYSGNVYFEAPKLVYLYKDEQFNILPAFNTSCTNNDFFDWLGMNLSKKEWPEFRIEINGNQFFEGELFERCHRYAEMEVTIPEGILKSRGNQITFTLISDYHDALPYAFREIAILEQPSGKPFDVICVPTVVDAEKAIPLVLKTSVPYTTIEFRCESGVLSAQEKTQFAEAGLHVLKMKATCFCNGAEFTLASGNVVRSYKITRMVKKECDGVVTGTGDQIYINQCMEDTEEYLCWYIANEVGNLLTIRPAYRWAGSRKVYDETWKKVAHILVDADIAYVHMVDGRDLPGLASNPLETTLDSPLFLGRQMHERDGQIFYWVGVGKPGRVSRMTDAMYNLAQRMYLRDIGHIQNDYSPINYESTEAGIHQCQSRIIDDDMKKTAEYAVEKIASFRGDVLRHSGPSFMSKYFYQAGYDYFSSELMYTTMEVTTAFLRGSAKSYGKQKVGAHHAMQWSSSPHNAPEKYRRYRLALYVSYMHGLHEINTEEGLWHIEEYYTYFHRFNSTCRSYLENQRDFVRYVKSHTRRGNFYTPMAYIHGRYDGTLGFRHAVFGGANGFSECDAEKSWFDLFKLFYPLSKPGESLYRHNCPKMPVGYHSGTPIGNVDAICLDGTVCPLSDYAAVCFAGYHAAMEEDFERLYEYVNNGGIVIMSWAHLSVTTKRDDIENNRFMFVWHRLIERLTEGEPYFIEDTVNGKEVSVCKNICSEGCVYAETDLGNPLVIEIKIGSGKIYFFNAKAYPHNPAIRDAYLNTVARVNAQLISQEPSWITCGNDVAFTVFEHEDGVRDFYVIAVDWYNEPEKEREFVLQVQGMRTKLTLPFGRMIKIAVSGNAACFADSEDGEIHMTAEGHIFVQGVGNMTVFMIIDGVLYRRKLSFDEVPELQIR